MKKNKTFILFIVLITIIALGYFVSDRLGCWKANYELRHSKVTITQQDSIQFFRQFINTDGEKNYQLSLVELGGVGCKPCRRMDSVLVDIRGIYKEKLNVQKLLVTNKKGKKIAKYFDLLAIPTQVLLDKKGKELFRHTGFLSKEELQKNIDKYLNK